MFEVGKFYETMNGSKVRCVSSEGGKVDFVVINGGHGDPGWAGEREGERYRTDSGGVFYYEGLELAMGVNIKGAWVDAP